MFDNVSDDGLLVAIDSERLPPITRDADGKVVIREVDEQKLNALIDAAIERGIYPKDTYPDNPNTVREMVRGWGAYWFRWDPPEPKCPHCGADLRDKKTGPPFLRQIGRSERDRVVEWECPDCGQFWPRE